MVVWRLRRGLENHGGGNAFSQGVKASSYCLGLLAPTGVEGVRESLLHSIRGEHRTKKGNLTRPPGGHRAGESQGTAE